MDFQLSYRRFSERSILVEWPSKIDEKILRDVLLFKNHLLSSNIKSIVQVNNAYSSILIIYDFTIDKINDEILKLKDTYVNRLSPLACASRLWKIPVCYDDEFGVDLDSITSAKNISKLELIERHTSNLYTVFFIGFLPGFLYLGGLDETLHMPRRITPRSAVKKGSVGIGGFQTGIYPNVSPGGWHIIGNSPLEFFDMSSENEPCFAKAGDRVLFFPVDKNQYLHIKTQVDNGSYRVESEVIDG